jgi:TetR/AcrR family transcriptional repressor of lmrAB and yxaGH operons
VGVTTDTRARMITSAALLLREHGVAGTSIPKVLAHSNGPRGSVGHHFPGGRTELITEAVAWAGQLVTDALTKARRNGSTPPEMFAFICDFYKKQLTSTDYAAGCPVGAAAQGAYDDPVIQPVIEDIIESWTGALAESLTDAGRPSREARDLALLCVASLEGAILLARVQRSTRAIDVVRSRLLPML